MTDEKKITLVIGKRGSGKSVLVKHLIAEARRLVVYDVMSEYTHGVCFEREDMDVLLSFWFRVFGGAFRIIYRPFRTELRKEDPKDIEWLARACFILGDITFVVEEIDAVCTAWVMPEWLSYCVQRGRHKNIELIGVTPAPFGINRDLTRQAKRICVFNTNEPKDIDYLAALMGSQVKSIVPALGEFEFMEWRDGRDDMVVGRLDEKTGQIGYRHERRTDAMASEPAGVQDSIGHQAASESDRQ